MNRDRANVEILVVDDEADVRDFCCDALRSAGFTIRTAESGRRALQVLEEVQIDIVLSDLKMPDLDGMELLRLIKERTPGIDVILMTGYAAIETAVRAIQMGAADYVAKPVSIDDLQSHLDRLIAWRGLALENQFLREQLRAQNGACGLVGSSPKMQEAYGTLLRFARKRQPVLIMGESGTGKELAARAIHKHGMAPDQPFVAIDCSALSPHLVESELFGHVRGAFTGAVEDRPGLLASAAKGTAFLDEIGELPLELQAKLLRALQEREFRPVGSNRAIPFQARIVAATNRNLQQATREGKFRSDLYYRLNVLTLTLPPLRERQGDIPALVQYFLLRHGTPEEDISGVTPDAFERLKAYSWPGNVRELENAIQRALAVSPGPVLALADFPFEIRRGHPACSGRTYSYLEQLECNAIAEALETAGGHRIRAAQMLGIGKSTLYRKLKDYGLDREGGPELAVKAEVEENT